MELVIASCNLHKIREFRELLQPIPHLEVLSARDFPNYTPPEETGLSFEENALLKARHATQTLGKWVLADDSGLVVPALNGEPGVLSARYAGDQASDAENRRRLLDKMAHLGDQERSAYFECCLVLSGPQGYIKAFKGICEGTLSTEERGNRGFGYDSLFIKHDYNKTFAELDEVTKNKVSHRRKAFDKFLVALETLLLQ